MSKLHTLIGSALLLGGCACGAPVAEPDAPLRQDGGVDASGALDALASGDAGSDAAADTGRDAPSDAWSCRARYAVGERFPAGDDCNFCTCQADGSSTCSARTCGGPFTTCTFEGREVAYGVRFDLGDGCNECVCAPSGIACTRRTCAGAREEGAILLESMNQRCGEREGFTPTEVLAQLPRREFTAPFAYVRDRELSPETLADTRIHVQVFAGSFAVCRLPSATQPAIDMDLRIEFRTEDGAFDEGGRGYLRRNDFGFVDAWWALMSLERDRIHGSYRPPCRFDAGDLTFDLQVERTGETSGDIQKVCETDIGLTVGAFSLPAL